ncbi:NAD(P)H-dependent flavin oxidoreductase [Oceanobacillus salinisoli]|uniref:NAD(P)H-dependent flavin oxidoreductase n=1 Tax=Oceanobacillus salinisoli TaxID=2678611 RepID=UPI0012E1FF0D|nr:DUF561 domain-containing protein [Oceanobacillus salinisoli]
MRKEVKDLGNSITDLLNIKYPIVQGGMGNVSDPKLSAAISNAGALGTIGVGTLPAEEVDRRIKIMVEHTDKPCCVNIPISVHPEVEKVMEKVLHNQVPVVSLSAGNPAKYIPMFHNEGIKVICVTASVKQAKKAEESGADIIVGEGYEAAGINALNESTTMTLIPQLSREVSVPVIAAGGIGDGRGLAAALSLGAAGIQMGTRFIAVKESNFHNIYKQAIIDATDDSTVIIGRKYNKIRRIMKGEYTDKLLILENENVSFNEFNEKSSELYHEIGALDGDMENGFINSGQIAGLIDDCPYVIELMERMVEEAKDILKNSTEKLQELSQGDWGIIDEGKRRRNINSS